MQNHADGTAELVDFGADPEVAVKPPIWRELRERLGLTQEDVAEAGGLGRVNYLRLESGDLKGGSAAAREGLARGFGLTAEQVVDGLHGKLSVEEAFESARKRAVSRAPARARGGTRWVYDPAAEIYPSRREVMLLALSEATDDDLVLLRTIAEEREHTTDPGRDHWLAKIAELQKERAKLRALLAPRPPKRRPSGTRKKT